MVRQLASQLGQKPAERWLSWLLAVTVFTLPFSAPLILSSSHSLVAGTPNSFATPAAYLPEILMLVSAVWWWLLRRPQPSQLAPFGWLAAVVVIALVASWWAPYQLLGLVAAGHMLIALAWLVVLANELRRPATAVLVASALVAAVSLQAVWGIAQFVHGRDFGLHKLGESILSADIRGVAKLGWDGVQRIRAYGSLPHPNILAAYVAAGLFTAGAVLLWPDNRRHPRRTWGAAVVCALLAAALLTTFSRVAVVTTAVIGTVVVLYALKGWRRIPPAAGVVAGAGILTLLLLWPGMAGRTALESQRETGITNRAIGYQLAGSMIADRPAGVGAGNFVLAAEELRADLPDYQYQPAHNTLLLAAAELGAVAAVLLIAWLVRLGWLFHQVRPRSSRERIINVSLFGLAGVFLAMSMVDHFFWSTPQGLWLAVLLAAAIISRLPEAEWHPGRPSKARRV